MLALDVKDLGAAIRDGRQSRAWTQQELADAVGVSRQWVVAIEKGESPAASVTLVIAALGVLGLVLDVVPEASDDLLDYVTGAS